MPISIIAECALVVPGYIKLSNAYYNVKHLTSIITGFSPFLIRNRENNEMDMYIPDTIEICSIEKSPL